MLKQIPVYKVLPVLMDDNYFEIAILDDPAIEEFALMYNKDTEIKFTVDDEKQIMVGPVIIPGKLIYKNDKLGERFTVFDQESIEQCVKLFFKKGMNFNFQHTGRKVEVEIIESYFAKEGNEFNVPVGSWIIKVHVADNSFWNEIKGKPMGFSIESIFLNYLDGISEIKNKKTKNMNVKEKMIDFINNVLFNENEPVTEPIVVPIVEPVIENVVPLAMAADEPVVEPVVEPVEKPEAEVINKEYIDKMFEDFMVKVQKMIEDSSNSSQVEDLKLKVEEFGRQPLIVSPVAEINTVISSANKYDFLKNIK
jgi:hypothetical protein